MKTLHDRIILIAILALATLVLAACGGQAIVEPELAPTAEPTVSEMVSANPAEAAQPAGSTGGPTVYVINADESAASYEVGETFLNQDNRFAIAVGVTHVVGGTITVDPANPANSAVGPITIDISQFKSDSSQRDNAIRGRWLESATYPIATFVPTEISGLSDSYTEGETLSFQVTGDLTIRDMTNPTTFDVTASLASDKLTGTATTTILMTDFGFDPPEIAGVLFVENDPVLSLDFVAYPE
ncbi:MAG: YceI family protein [Anaerolineae bacterium]|nr:YceI family protein [Anaerolineae bacterium]